MAAIEVERAPQNPHGYRADLLTPDAFPALGTISAAFMFSAVVRPNCGPVAPQYVFVPCKRDPVSCITEEMVTLSEWNMMWECGHIRPDYFEGKLPSRVKWIERPGAASFRFVPFFEGRNTSGKLAAYEPLRSLLPLHLLRRFGLAPKRGVWPNTFTSPTADNRPATATSLARAFAEHMWPLLSSGSSLYAFAENESIRLLTHNLDYWLPYIDLLVQMRAEAVGRVKFESDDQQRELEAAQASLPPEFDAAILRPRFGFDVWSGEEEAWEAAQEMVELADAHGRLRAVLDAIRSHRVQDDFSARWSFAKEDFERKLHAKRLKVKVTFVELRDTMPVFAPDAEADCQENLLWQDLFAVVNKKDRRVVVCLRNGTSSATEIARELGYASHSPVSKALARIREKAERLFR
jgi:hypothetical protein